MLVCDNPPIYQTSPKSDLTLQPLQPGLPQLVFWQHPTNGPLQYLPSSPLPHHTLHIQRLERSGSCGLLVIQLLLHLLSSSVHISTTGSHNVVSAICGWIPDRFMFAHKYDGDLGGNAA